MAYNPDDYDEVYETKSAPEKTELLGNGWVLLDERFEPVSGEPHESFAHRWLETATKGGGRGGYAAWSRAAKEPEFFPAPQQETTYVLGWPKGQQTISEDDPPARPSAAANAQQVTEGSVGQASDAEASSQSDSPEVSAAEGAPEGSDDPATSDVPDAPTAPSPPDEVGSY